MLLKENNENLSDSYKIIATCFNYFFLNEKPAEVLEEIRELLLDDNYVKHTSKKEFVKLGCFYDALNDFKNFWYLPAEKDFDCPFDYFLNFVKDHSDKHLKILINLASDSNQRWLKLCLKNSKKITALKVEDLKNEMKDLYQNTSKNDLKKPLSIDFNFEDFGFEE